MPINTKMPHALRYLLITCAVIIFLLLSYLKVFEHFELATLDLRFKIRPLQKTADNIAIIEIADDTLNQLGEWPISRRFHAAVLDVLSEYGAKAVVFDILFSQPTGSDAELIESVGKSNRAYLACALRVSENKPKEAVIAAESYDSRPLEELARQARGVGHINIIPDIDGKRRKSPLFFDLDGRLIPHLSLLAFCDSSGIDISKARIKKGKYIEIGPGIKIPIDSKGETLINYAGKWEKAFSHYSFVDILKSYVSIQKGQRPIIDLNQLKDKICFIGCTAVATHDLNPVPLQKVYPMVGVHANLVNMIECKSFIVRASPIANLAILILLLGAVFIPVIRTRPITGNITAAVLFIAFTASSFILFAFLNIWIDLFCPVILMLVVYLLGNVLKYVTERNKRLVIERELDIAKRIQRSFLKEQPPQVSGFDIAVIMNPAKAVGGDLYDFIEMGAGSIGVMIGDVSGKGVPAALFMAKTVSDFRFHAKTEKDPLKAIDLLNRQMSVESGSGLFVTLAYALFNNSDRSLSIINAGHLPVISAAPDKKAYCLNTEGGMALGIMDAVEFKRVDSALSSGEIFVFYTDGVTEARNSRKEELGEKRLKEAIEKYKSLPAQDIAKNVYEEVTRFIGKAPQHDDITILVVKIVNY